MAKLMYCRGWVAMKKWQYRYKVNYAFQDFQLVKKLHFMGGWKGIMLSKKNRSFLWGLKLGWPPAGNLNGKVGRHSGGFSSRSCTLQTSHGSGRTKLHQWWWAQFYKTSDDFSPSQHLAKINLTSFLVKFVAPRPVNLGPWVFHFILSGKVWRLSRKIPFVFFPFVILVGNDHGVLVIFFFPSFFLSFYIFFFGTEGALGLPTTNPIHPSIPSICQSYSSEWTK